VKVFTTRSGQTLHASASCPHLDGRQVLKIDRDDALPVAELCTTPLCVMVWARQAGKVA
jgi:hypothetical protein